MIIDSLEQSEKYFDVHPLFEKAFAFINSQDFETVEAGNFTVDGENLKAIFSNSPGKTIEASTAGFECHYQHIDIHLCIDGSETIGWKPRGKCLKPNGIYNEEADVQLFLDAPDMFFQLNEGQFVILFPEDVHAPMIGEGPIKKLVMKVKI
jgi:YhcH/YjgK/YiaL family protein